MIKHFLPQMNTTVEFASHFHSNDVLGWDRKGWNAMQNAYSYESI